MIVSPPRTCSPGCTSSVAFAGTKTSMRDPNFINPNRSPAATSSPTESRQTIRRASMPTTCRIDHRRALVVDPDLGPLVHPRIGLVGGQEQAGVIIDTRTRPHTGTRLMCTSSGDRKIVTCSQSPGGDSSGRAGPACITRPSAGDDDDVAEGRRMAIGIAKKEGEETGRGGKRRGQAGPPHQRQRRRGHQRRRNERRRRLDRFAWVIRRPGIQKAPCARADGERRPPGRRALPPKATRRQLRGLDDACTDGGVIQPSRCRDVAGCLPFDPSTAACASSGSLLRVVRVPINNACPPIPSDDARAPDASRRADGTRRHCSATAPLLVRVCRHSSPPLLAGSEGEGVPGGRTPITRATYHPPGGVSTLAAPGVQMSSFHRMRASSTGFRSNCAASPPAEPQLCVQPQRRRVGSPHLERGACAPRRAAAASTAISNARPEPAHRASAAGSPRC